MNEKFSKLGFYPSDILLPKKDCLLYTSDAADD